MLELLTGLSKWSISVPCRLPAFVALRGFAERMLRSPVAGMLRAAPAVARIAHAHRLLLPFRIAGVAAIHRKPIGLFMHQDVLAAEDLIAIRAVKRAAVAQCVAVA